MQATHRNRLKDETSPYLLQHANNPVHWFAWGQEALNEAKLQNKPILLSIGYSACHWCHVMEKESFENDSVAELMNTNFINIKVDREERPDLDNIYMEAIQAIAGNGGWPLNVFLTPDAKPFFGGTYFPPERAYNRPGWKDVLLSVKDAWLNKKEEIELQASQLIEHIQHSNNFGGIKNIIETLHDENFFSNHNCTLIKDNLLKNADKTEGGFGKAPKFPQTFSLQYLLQYACFFKDDIALQHAELSLHKMINGGIYDQLGGGLCRYSTDDKWLVPHFEKMLYDNALLLNVLSDAYQLTKNNFYQSAIHSTIRFLLTEMKNPEGGFYAALDADSEGVEGKFYVWSKTEVDNILEKNSEAFCKYFNITLQGNWEHTNILNITSSADSISKSFNLSKNEWEQLISGSRQKLLQARNKRVRPATDDKIILSWNALLITAFCKSYAATSEEAYANEAIQLYQFIEKKFINTHDKTVFHTYKDGIAKHPAFLDDYAYFIEACIYLQEITGQIQYLLTAKQFTEDALQNFADPESSLFYYTGNSQTDIVVKKIEVYDGATASANAIMAHNLLYLSIIFDKKEWHNRAANMIKGMSNVTIKYPGSFAVWASAYLKLCKGINEIAITGTDINALRKQIINIFNPFRVIQSGTKEENYPLLKGKAFNTEPTIYLCRNYSCEKPVKNVAELALLMKI
ncbi:MAG: thioredoxin domain-containing protein [Bacteroidetes bacterium]|nr:thioredoxin domain-containing protein [Bacteroidota bacterium]